MSTYLVGDIHGCYDQLKLLLRQVSFNPVKDTLWCTGDLVCRGSKSLDVLCFLFSLGEKAKIVLGNHDLYLLSVYYGINDNKIEDGITDIFKYKDAEILISWLRKQPLLQINEEKKIIMSHAGIYPKWNIKTLVGNARKVESILSGKDYLNFLGLLYENNAHDIVEDSIEYNSLRFIVNAFTRMRYLFPNGNLNMVCKQSPSYSTLPLQPWFSIKNNISKEYSIFFGHWSSLSGKNLPNNIFGLDTGCCWGNKLSMICLENKTFFSQSCSMNK
ncbi:symmetrical bis(5'-nucleosyl)-tetraphosphatase [Buchnera aphidicola (Pemphigus obesinymphae)]|uniref:symmetrical bis(5'-nucleosyl)-tetraphosphatase n=1 Tax=Buchnera aphidicola TaxID=9 RepID=UPI002236F657|nr:symmetrical bis(5'-nucleosyl)-tetraphosphatase [Buchnera aphidicola]MCW5196580.1 symmetrical bis(5'-nucleosyl)-tetraphosphatase [Buchnera aphidicola (Pemphigus obesinymphae)]